MEAAILFPASSSPPPPLDHHFNFQNHPPTSSPFTTAPSSPRLRDAANSGSVGTDLYFSAPTSPTRSSSSSSCPGVVAFDWEGKPNEDFEFDFSGQLDFTRHSASAEELFESGRIRPLKPPPWLQSDTIIAAASSLRRPSEFSCGILSPRRNSSPADLGFDPFAAAAIEVRQRNEEEEEEEGQEAPLIHGCNRGRDRKVGPGSVARRETRSLPPLRVSDVIFDDVIEDESSEGRVQDSISREGSSETRGVSYLAPWMWFSKWQGYGHRRWRLRDLLLFRSASEGSGTRNIRGKENVAAKHVATSYGSGRGRWAGDSFRSSTEESVGSTSLRRKLRAGSSNGVELHYTMNRAMSEEMRRKTFLPYRQGLLGCLGFGGGHPGNGGGSVRDIARGIGSLTRGQ